MLFFFRVFYKKIYIKCKAVIYKIKVDGHEVNPTCCGFVPYSPSSNIEVKFRAYHPNNFADLSFTVKKGTCSDSVQSGKTNARGMVIGNAITTDGAGYYRNGYSEYTRTFSPADLLGISGGKDSAALSIYMSQKYPELDIETDPEAIDADSPFPSEEEEPDQDESPKP